MIGNRLLPVSGKQMVKVFRKIGFQVDRQRGSHIVMSRDDIILVIPNHKTVAKGTERELIKDAGLTIGEFNTGGCLPVFDRDGVSDGQQITVASRTPMREPDGHTNQHGLPAPLLFSLPIIPDQRLNRDG